MPKLRWLGRPLTQGEISEILLGSKAIYYYGVIQYRDAFKRKRSTKFRLVYAGKFPPPKGVIFSICEKGNEAN